MLQTQSSSRCGLQRSQSAAPSKLHTTKLNASRRTFKAASPAGPSNATTSSKRGQAQIVASLTKRADELNTTGRSITLE
jgi:hypothetical protein